MRGRLVAFCVLAAAGIAGSCGGSAFTSAKEDGGAADSGVPIGDGGSDAPVVLLPDAASRWCATQTTAFCADFDEFADINKLLNSFTTFGQDNGHFALDFGTGAPSAPNSLLVNADKDARALVFQMMPAFARLPGKLRLEFALRIDSAANIGAFAAAGFASIVMGPTINDGLVAVGLAKDSLIGVTLESVDAGSGYKSQAAGVMPTTGQWAGRYALEITYAAAPQGVRTGCVQIFSGAVPLLSPCLPLPASMTKANAVSIAVGVYSGGLFGGNTGNLILRFDNVTFDIQ